MYRPNVVHLLVVIQEPDAVTGPDGHCFGNELEIPLVDDHRGGFVGRFAPDRS
jgi:hypothetical protein